jgi:hypothetical protein
MATRPDGPPMLVRPLPFTPTQLSYYTESLRLPPGGRVVCYLLAPLDQLEPRLAGWLWNVFGIEVSPTPDPPPYPFIRLAVDGAVLAQMEVYLWQVCPIGAPQWAELRWSPTEKRSLVNFASLSNHQPERRRQEEALNRAVELTKYTMLKGRPVGSRSRGGLNDEAFLDQLIELVHACWRTQDRPTEDRILRLFPGGVSKSSLQRFVHNRLGMGWDDFIEIFRPR